MDYALTTPYPPCKGLWGDGFSNTPRHFDLSLESQSDFGERGGGGNVEADIRETFTVRRRPPFMPSRATAAITDVTDLFRVHSGNYGWLETVQTGNLCTLNLTVNSRGNRSPAKLEGK